MKGFLFAVCLSLPAGLAQSTDDATSIMTKMAANREKAAELRRQFVYQQAIKGSLVHSDGKVSRKESREYAVTPQASGTERKLVSFQGEYRKGKQVVSYTEPGYKYKDEDIDGELLGDLIEDLTNDKDSRDGISESLFPLRTKDLRSYRFAVKGRTVSNGRPAYVITFEPVPANDLCIHVGDEGHNCKDQPWKGEAWIDVEDLQPVRIDTALGKKISWAVRTFLGTNLRQLGFSIAYTRVADGVWFPSAYGTEFHVDVLWFYKRTVTLSLVNSGFRKTEASSTITYDLH